MKLFPAGFSLKPQGSRSFPRLRSASARHVAATLGFEPQPLGAARFENALRVMELSKQYAISAEPGASPPS